MLNDFKLLLGLDQADTSQDAKLTLILSQARARLARLLGGMEPPDALQDMVLEVAVKRYNRIGAEGMAGHTVEGESMQFSDNDFAEFSNEIQTFLENQAGSKTGKVRFL